MCEVSTFADSYVGIGEVGVPRASFIYPTSSTAKGLFLSSVKRNVINTVDKYSKLYCVESTYAVINKLYISKTVKKFC